MNPRTTVGLSVALIVAVVGVWWAQSSTRPEGSPSSADAKTLFDPPIGDVTAFEVVQTSSGQPTQLTQEDGKWRMTAPAAGPGEQNVITADVNKLKGLTYVKAYPPKDPDRPSDEMTSLKTPGKIVKLTDKSKSYTLKIGSRQTLSTNTYVQKEGDETIYLVASDLNAELRKDPSEYRGKQLTQFAQNEAVRLEVSGEQNYTLSNVAGKWTMDSPLKGRADRSKVTSLLSTLSNLSVQKFVEDAPQNLRPYGLEKPRLLIAVTTEKRTPKPPPAPPASAPAEPQFDVKTETIKLAFGGSADDKVFAKMEEPASPAVIQFAETSYKQIALPLDELRDRNVADMSGGHPQKISLTSDGDHVELTSTNGVWQITGGLPGGSAPAEFAAVDDLQKAIRGLTAIGFETAELPSQGFKNPRAIVEVTLEGRLDPIRLDIGAKTSSGTGAYVRNEREGFIAVVKAESVDALTAKPVSFMSRDLLAFDKAHATQIELVYPEWSALLSKSGDAWKFQRPVQGPTEALAVNNVLNDLSQLRGRRVVGRAEDRAKFGLDKPIVKATVTVQPPPKPRPPTTTSQPAPEEPPPPPVVRSVLVTRHQDSVYAMTPDGKTICEIDPKVIDDLVAELYDTRIATLEPSQGRKLTVGGASPFSFRKEGDQWRLVGEPTFEVDPAKITEVFTALRDLRAGQFVRYSGAKPAEYGLDKPEYTITADTEGGESVQLLISSRGKSPGDRYAATAAVPDRVFLLKAADLPKFAKQLSDFRKQG